MVFCGRCSTRAVLRGVRSVASGRRIRPLGVAEVLGLPGATILVQPPARLRVPVVQRAGVLMGGEQRRRLIQASDRLVAAAERVKRGRQPDSRLDHLPPEGEPRQ